MNDLLFFFRKNLRGNFIHTCLFSDGVCCSAIVSGKHDNADAHISELLNGPGGILADGIGHGNQTKEPSVLLKVHRCFSAFGKSVRSLSHIRMDGGLCQDKFFLSSGNLFTLKNAGQPVSGKNLKIRKSGEIRISCFLRVGGVGNDGFGKRMLGMKFESSCLLKKLRFGDAISRKNIGHSRSSARNGAGFIKRCDLNISGLL